MSNNNRITTKKKAKHSVPVPAAFQQPHQIPAASWKSSSSSLNMQKNGPKVNHPNHFIENNGKVLDLERLKRITRLDELQANEADSAATSDDDHMKEDSKLEKLKEVIFPKSPYEYDRSLEPVQPFRGFTSRVREMIAESVPKSSEDDAQKNNTSASLEGFIALPSVEKNISSSSISKDIGSTPDEEMTSVQNTTRFKGNWNIESATTNDGASLEAQDAPSTDGAHKKKRTTTSPTPAAQNKNPVTSPWIYLHNEIISYRNHVSPSQSDLQERERVIELVRSTAKDLWPQSATRVFGSTATGLCLPDSDVDICVFDTSPNAIYRLSNAFKTRRMVEMLQVLDKAYVPIIKLKFLNSPFTCDISFDQPGGISTATFIKRVMEEMPEVKPLVLVVKHFLAQRDLNETYKGGMGSYLCFLTVVAVCQRARRMNPEYAENLASLLLQYFDFYGNVFNYEDVGISLFHGGHFFRKKTRAWSAGPLEKAISLCLEDPMNPEVDIGKKSYKMTLVRHAFSIAHSHLLKKLEAFDVSQAIKSREIASKVSSSSSSVKRRKSSSYAEEEDDHQQNAMDTSILATVIRLDSHNSNQTKSNNNKRIKLGRNVKVLHSSSSEEEDEEEFYFDEDDDDDDI
jgi:non-canonical poly(A) RNA polymerase PAPD5/7